MIWEQEYIIRIPYMMPASLVESGNRKVLVPTAFTGDPGISLLTARAGSVSLCFKYHKAQTIGHLAPGCEDELSGLDPANRAAFSFNEGHTETKGYSGGIGLCQLTEKHGIKTPTGSVTFPELQSISYVRARLKPARRARNSRRLAVDIVISMGGNDE